MTLPVSNGRRRNSTMSDSPGRIESIVRRLSPTTTTPASWLGGRASETRFAGVTPLFVTLTSIVYSSSARTTSG